MVLIRYLCIWEKMRKNKVCAKERIFAGVGVGVGVKRPGAEAPG